MKASIVTMSDTDVPSQMFAVVLDDPGAKESGSILAMFLYAIHAKEWGDANYATRFKAVEVRL